MSIDCAMLYIGVVTLMPLNPMRLNRSRTAWARTLRDSRRRSLRTISGIGLFRIWSYRSIVHTLHDRPRPRLKHRERGLWTGLGLQFRRSAGTRALWPWYKRHDRRPK